MTGSPKATPPRLTPYFYDAAKGKTVYAVPVSQVRPEDFASYPMDEQILAVIRDGCRTGHVADRLGMLKRRPYILRRLKRLEAQGKVVRNERYSYPHDFYWERAS